jgi:hypothetical protein
VTLPTFASQAQAFAPAVADVAAAVARVAEVVEEAAVAAAAVEASAVEALAVAAVAVAVGEFAGAVAVEALILDRNLSVLAEEKLAALTVYGCPYTLAVVAVDVFGDVVGVVLNIGRKVAEVEPADEDGQVLQGRCAGYRLQVGAYKRSH